MTARRLIREAMKTMRRTKLSKAEQQRNLTRLNAYLDDWNREALGLREPFGIPAEFYTCASRKERQPPQGEK